MRVLSSPEVSAKYKPAFIGAHADFGELELDDNSPGHGMVKRYNARKLRPVLVFLDSSGKEVARHTGKLNDAADALRLQRYVAEKHYLKTSWQAFRSRND